LVEILACTDLDNLELCNMICKTIFNLTIDRDVTIFSPAQVDRIRHFLKTNMNLVEAQVSSLQANNSDSDGVYEELPEKEDDKYCQQQLYNQFLQVANNLLQVLN